MGNLPSLLTLETGTNSVFGNAKGIVDWKGIGSVVMHQ